MNWLIFFLVSGLSFVLSLKEVGFPWGILTAILALAFTVCSAVAWKWVLKPHESILRNGTFAYLVTVLVPIVIAVILLMIITALPGATPTGVLSLSSAYAFLSVALARSRAAQ